MAPKVEEKATNRPVSAKAGKAAEFLKLLRALFMITVIYRRKCGAVQIEQFTKVHRVNLNLV